MKTLLRLTILALATILLTACSSQSQAKKTELSTMPKIEGITYHGDIPKKPKKLVNFTYSYTGYLLQLGIDVSSYSLDLEKDSPAFGGQLKNAKKLTTADTEAIAAEEPDLIMVFAGDDNIESLKAIAPVIEITYGKRDYLQMMTDLGTIFGKEKEASDWLTKWDKQVAQAKKDLAQLPNDTTFTLMDFFDKNIYLYGDNFGRGGDLIYQALGYQAPDKVVKDVFKDGWFAVSQESLGDYIGDYAVVNVNDATKNAAASLKESDVWKNIPAVKNNKVLEVDYNLFYFTDPISLEQQLPAFVQAIKDSNS